MNNSNYNQLAAEYFFDYKIKKIDDNLEVNDETLKIYIEKIISPEIMGGFQTFLVVQDWLEPKEKATNLKFDTVQILFDINGIDSATLNERLDETSQYKKIEKKIKMNIDSYRKNEYKIILSNNTDGISGSGQVKLINSEINKEATFYFAINFNYKEKIYYTLTRSKNYITHKDYININFKNTHINQDIALYLLTGIGRVPCLKIDKDTINENTPNFTISNQNINKRFTYSLPFNKNEKNYYWLDFVNPELNKFYLLEALENESLKIKHYVYEFPKPTLICPYCGEMIKVKKFNKHYKRGGIACDKSFMKIGNQKIDIIKSGVDEESQNAEADSKAKNIIYCKKDVDKMNPVFNVNRTLPLNYLNKKHFRLVIIGSKRSGKTTFISRLFNILATQKNEFSFRTNNSYILNECDNLFETSYTDMPSLRGSGELMNLYEWSIEDATISTIDEDKTSIVGLSNGFTYLRGNPKMVNLPIIDVEIIVDLTDESKENLYKDGKIILRNKSPFQFLSYFFKYYVNSEQAWCLHDGKINYKNFVMGLGENRSFPPTTTNLDEEEFGEVITKYPFFLNINKKNDIVIYDIAGENIENHNDFVVNQLTGKGVGIFFLLDIGLPRDGIEKALSILDLNKSNVNKNNPIAIIATKFDKIETEFNPNCYCLRNDFKGIINRINYYEGSELERNIDMSSKEIESYLIKKGITLPKLKNIKYFNFSTFSTPDSILHIDKTDENEEENYLRFMSSPKRMELPYIWMIKQFGLIK